MPGLALLVIALSILGRVGRARSGGSQSRFGGVIEVVDGETTPLARRADRRRSSLVRLPREILEPMGMLARAAGTAMRGEQLGVRRSVWACVG